MKRDRMKKRGAWILFLFLILMFGPFIYYSAFIYEPVKKEESTSPPKKVAEKKKPTSPPKKEDLEKECERLNDSIYNSFGYVKFKFLFYTGNIQEVDVELPRDYGRGKEYNRTINCIPRVSFYIDLYKVDGDKIVKYRDDWNAIIGVSYIMEEGEWRSKE